VEDSAVAEVAAPAMSTRVAWGLGPWAVRLAGKLAWRLELDRSVGFPDPPFVLASNHHSFLDPFLLGAAWGRRMRFLGLVDLYGKYRVVDFGLRVFEAIPLERGVVPLGPIRTSLGHLSAGGVLGLFPEGTRHWEFDPGRARPGAAWLATRADVPLVPAAIIGSQQVLGVDNKLRKGRIRVTIGPPLAPEGTSREAIDDLTGRWAAWVSNTLQRRPSG
jgi:1-acyl-sn-glycerol-3-phosphate acyltransferase